MEEIQEIIEFTKKFFENLGADISFREGFLIISNVPEDFQKFYGKKCPYKFVFSEKDLTGDAELVERGSYLLKTISNYLENSGQTTLLKINFKVNAEEEIKRQLKIKNGSFGKFTKKKRFDIFFRFTFHTTFQFLNEKEKLINEIYIYKGVPIEGNLSDYDIEEGIKNEIRVPDIKEAYFISKDELKKRIEEKTKEIAEILTKKFEKEKERIEDHFFQENKEFSESMKKAIKKLDELKKESNIEKIQRQLTLINSIKSKMNFEDFEKDKNRAIELERQRHILNVNNKLFNTTIVYYPLGVFDLILKSKDKERTIEVVFDPLTKKLNPLFCESCQKEINEINLCTSTHISCKECISECESCFKSYCKRCLMTKCTICGKKICRDCSVRCFKCGKEICLTHTKQDKISKRIYCTNCLKRCERCGNTKEPYGFKLSKKTNVEICEECYRKEMQDKVLKEIFN